MKKTCTFVALALALCALSPCRPVSAAEIIPSWYTFTPDNDHQGTWNYVDPDKQKLTDGIYGSDDWTQSYNPAGGYDINEGEWVAWPGLNLWSSSSYSVNDVMLTFHFDTQEPISSIVLGVNQDTLIDYNVVFPSFISVNINGAYYDELHTPFSYDNSGSEHGGTNNGQRHDVVFNFNPIVPDTVTISLNNEENFANLFGDLNDFQSGKYLWIFTDEVDFNTEPYSVPEPATMLLLIIGVFAVFGFGARGKRV